MTATARASAPHVTHIVPPNRPDPQRASRVRRAGGIRYSRFVGLMKILLPSTAAVLLGLVLAWPQLTGRDLRFELGFVSVNPRTADTSTMASPRYQGLDGNNRPFVVTATMATQPDPSVTVVLLEEPKADMVMADGAAIIVEAQLGYYRQDDQTLDLTGGVDLYHDTGYELHSSSARVDLAGKAAVGDEPVVGQGPLGELEGQGFRIEQEGRVVHLTGKSTMLMRPARGGGAP